MTDREYILKNVPRTWKNILDNKRTGNSINEFYKQVHALGYHYFIFNSFLYVVYRTETDEGSRIGFIQTPWGEDDII